MPSKQQSVIGSLFLWPPAGSHREDQNSSQVGRGFKMEFGCGCVYTREAQSCCCSVAQCSTLCDPMDCSTPGFPVLHHLPELAQTPVHRVGVAIQPSHPLSSPSAFSLSQHQGLFLWVDSLHQVAKVLELQVWNIGIFLPMNIQDWFPLGWTGWVPLQSKGLPRVFSNTTVQKHQFSGA